MAHVTLHDTHRGPLSLDPRPFTGPLGQPVDDALRSRLALLSPRQEAVLRLRYAIGTSVARTRQEVAILLSMNVSEIQRLEDQAAAIVWWNDFVPAGSDRVNH
jgi:hypothetical protein